MVTQHYKFQLEPLPYRYDALEPFIDARTLCIHHSKHLQTYTDNLNKALEPYPQFHDWPLEVLLYNLGMLPDSIRTSVKNNAGGVYNHNLYFDGMARTMQRKPSGKLADRINIDFGNYEELKKQLKRETLSVFGSGWAWLTVNHMGKLVIISTANQDTTLELNLCPILTIDIWEHAYYLKYQNYRDNYIDCWFNTINWNQAEQNYNSCKIVWAQKSSHTK